MAKTKVAAAAAAAPPAEAAAPAQPMSMLDRVLKAHRDAERAGDHHGAAVLNGVLLALGEARHAARTALSAVDDKLDGTVLREARGMSSEVREILEAAAAL